MKQRLTQTQLERVIAEVQALSQRQHEELDEDRVKEILQELNLPPELLNDAMVQLHRRDALAVQQQRHRWLVGGAVGAIALVVVGTTLVIQNQRQTLSRVEAQGDRITLTQDDGGNLSTVVRQQNPEVFYRITLSDAPIGQKLSLSCDWIDPTGQTVHQNRYQTKEITTPVWDTHCRHTIGAAAPTGTWTVRAFLGDRPLSDATFQVE